MNKRGMITVIGALLLATVIAGTAAAEYGAWELRCQYGLLYNQSALLSLSAVDAEHLFTTSVHQDGASSAQLAHFSTDGGYSWQVWRRMEVGAGFCDVFKFIHMYLDVHMYNLNEGVMGGFGINDDCLDLLPEPLCLLCVFMNGIEAQWTDDGGVTWNKAQVIDKPTNGSLTAMQMFDDGTGFGVGQVGTFMRTDDGGHTWEQLGNPDPSQEDWEVKGQHLHFLDDQVGYVVTGLYDEDVEDPVRWSQTTSAQDVIDWMTHYARLRNDPFYRRAYYLAHPLPAKGVNGKALKTQDGGLSWTPMYSDVNRHFSRVFFVDEDHGYIIGESHLQQIEPAWLLLETRDGGETWDPAPLPDWNTIPGLQRSYALLHIKFSSPYMGFVIGVGLTKLGMTKTLIFYTQDGGFTWQYDPFDEGIFDPLDIEFVDRDAFVIGQGFMSIAYLGVNSTPLADAGDDQTVVLGATAMLDGSGSYDIDGEPLAYLWEQTAGESMPLSSYDQPASSFVATQLGEFTFELMVSDGEINSEPDQVTITVVEEEIDDDDDDNDDDDNDTGDDDDDNDDNDNDDDDDDDGCGCQA